MRHSPYSSEYEALKSMSDTGRLEYFMSRVFEAEEVWFLNNKNSYFFYECAGETRFVVWPYKVFATEAALDHWHDGAPAACSLEYFLDQTLEFLHNNNIILDILPRGDTPGCLISPKRLQAILQGMIDAGEYRLDS